MFKTSRINFQVKLSVQVLGDRLATIDIGQKLGDCAPFLQRGTGSSSVWPGPRHTSIPSGILIHSAVWPQQTWAENEELCPFWGGELGPHLAQCGLGQGLPPYQLASWSIQLFGHNRHGPKIGEGHTPLGRWAGSPSNARPKVISYH